MFLHSAGKVLKLEKASGCTIVWNALNTTKLYTLRWLIVWYVNFTSTLIMVGNSMNRSTN